MKINTNSWNKIRYTLYAPAYDIIGNLFNSSRKRSIENLHIEAGEKVLLIGAGTGIDLAFLNPKAEITATDITPSMVEAIKKRSGKLGIKVNAAVMDGHQLKFQDAEFDKVILHLIVAVIPDPVKCIKEAERVLKPGGRIAVFDKFVPQGKKKSLLRSFLNVFTNTLFSDINRDFQKIVSETKLVVEKDEAVGQVGNYRIIILRKK